MPPWHGASFRRDEGYPRGFALEPISYGKGYSRSTPASGSGTSVKHFMGSSVYDEEAAKSFDRHAIAMYYKYHCCLLCKFCRTVTHWQQGYDDKVILLITKHRGYFIIIQIPFTLIYSTITQHV
jgi:hypothetical protein